MDNDGWISVKDRPLYIVNKDMYWECTKDGDQEILVAVPYADKKQPDKELWWIRHCVIQDRIGLCVVGDDDNEPAGWELNDVEYWQPIPKSPITQ